jgi:hypothetical protein
MVSNDGLVIFKGIFEFDFISECDRDFEGD